MKREKFNFSSAFPSHLAIGMNKSDEETWILI